MIIVPFSDALRLQWDAFVDASPEAWFFSRATWLDYCVAYRPGAINRSFAIEQDGQLVAICPLIQEGEQFTMGGEPGAAPVHATDSLEVRALVLDGIDDAAKQYDVRRAAFRHHPRWEDRPTTAPPGVLRAGYREISWSTRLLDLTQPESTLWRGVRKGHRADIRKAERTYQIMTSWSASDFGFYEYAHQQAHPGARPLMTYDLQRGWVRRGHGLVVIARPSDIGPLAAAFFLVYRDAAYYASSAALIPDVMAAVVWRGILALKARGVRMLELGWCERPGDSEKAKGVAHFKSGFSSNIVPVYAVDKLIPIQEPLFNTKGA